MPPGSDEETGTSLILTMFCFSVQIRTVTEKIKDAHEQVKGLLGVSVPETQLRRELQEIRRRIAVERSVDEMSESLDRLFAQPLSHRSPTFRNEIASLMPDPARPSGDHGD